MKDLNKSVGSVGQNTAHKKPNKHDVNLQKNSILYFQVGLILCLLATYALFDMNFQYQIEEYVVNSSEPDEEDTFNEIFVVEKKVLPKQVKQLTKQEQKIINEIEEVENDHSEELEKSLFPENEPDQDDSNPVGDVVDPVDPEGSEIDEVSITAVQNVPVFPGCEKYEGNNEDLFECMSNKIGKIVNRKFDTDLANDYGLSGIQRIYVQFKIDKQGNVTDIKARAPHNALQNEAVRVTNKIPQMSKPGLQNNKPVTVLYSLPIVFKVQD